MLVFCDLDGDYLHAHWNTFAQFCRFLLQSVLFMLHFSSFFQSVILVPLSGFSLALPNSGVMVIFTLQSYHWMCGSTFLFDNNLLFKL